VYVCVCVCVCLYLSVSVACMHTHSVDIDIHELETFLCFDNSKQSNVSSQCCNTFESNRSLLQNIVSFIGLFCKQEL